MSLPGWTRDNTLELINKYKEKKALWDPTDVGYFSHRNKAILWEELASEIGSSVDETRRRMQSLLASMRRERARVKRSLAKCGEQYKSTWFAYDSLSFLLDRPNPNSFFKNSMDTHCEDSNGREDSEKFLWGDIASGQALGEFNGEISHLQGPTYSVKYDDDSLIENNDVGSKEGQVSEVEIEEPSENDVGNRRRNKRLRVDGICNGRRWRRNQVSSVPIESFTNGNLVNKRSMTESRKNNVSPMRYFDHSNNDCVTFGSYVAEKLKMYSWSTKCAVQHAISEILFSADQGRFDSYCEDYSSSVSNIKEQVVVKAHSSAESPESISSPKVEDADL